MTTSSTHKMIEMQLRTRGISDEALLAAFQRVDRADFVLAEDRNRAYEDYPLPIGEGQTISQPYVVALMGEALGLQGSERLLDVGTGSGYAAAVMGHMCAEVFGIERVEVLAQQAKQRLATLGYHKVHVRSGDGTKGWPERAPFDAIAVAAGAPEIPEALLAQLAEGGRLVMPVGPEQGDQILTRVVKLGDSQYRYEALSPVRFVPLIADPEPLN